MDLSILTQNSQLAVAFDQGISAIGSGVGVYAKKPSIENGGGGAMYCCCFIKIDNN